MGRTIENPSGHVNRKHSIDALKGSALPPSDPEWDRLQRFFPGCYEKGSCGETFHLSFLFYFLRFIRGIVLLEMDSGFDDAWKGR